MSERKYSVSGIEQSIKKKYGKTFIFYTNCGKQKADCKRIYNSFRHAVTQSDNILNKQMLLTILEDYFVGDRNLYLFGMC